MLTKYPLNSSIRIYGETITLSSQLSHQRLCRHKHSNMEQWAETGSLNMTYYKHNDREF
jgi:hypothetical protein